MSDKVQISIRNAGKKLLQLINLERKEVGQIYFFATLTGLIQLSLPLGIQAIIGLLFGGVLSASLVVLISFVVVGVLLSGMIQVMQMRVTESIQQRIFTRLTFAYAYRIPRIDLLSVDSYYLPELVNRFFDTASLQKGLSKLLLDIPGASIQILFGLVLLSFYHPVFIILGLILLIIVWIIFYLSSHKGFTTSMEESEYKYEVGHWLEEISRAIKTFKFSQKHQLHMKRTDELTAGYLDARSAHFKVLVFQYRALIAFKVIITAAMLVIGTLLFLKQQINLGQFIAAEIIIIAVLNSVEKLIVSLETLYDVLTSIEKLDKVLQKPHDNELSTATTGNIDLKQPLTIAVQNLSFSFNNRKPVIDQLTFDVKPGEKICINGKEGSGKTTLLRIIAGLYSGYSGQILINGIPLQNIPAEVWRSRVAIFFAREELFGGTLWDNLTLGDEQLNLSFIVEICQLVGLQAFIDASENGYNTLLNPQGQKLSDSVIQKILLARCFLLKPALLVMENGWQGIENEHRSLIIDKLINDKSFSLIAISNLEELNSVCDKLITLNK
ncbi:peptidase domain-containing ABC transporter [Mucilaginibacter psychrotolerans]|uniref:ABC transporter ATP-binding protein n=1 Tax=Mucilaginibacter psychrotolerans TaxID=1524096 RepID=A0A4Y8S4H8_9SPHI|nr:ABC transporter ATP-binding protein [Mucilaginibacter psychrotolerans]TFF33324.1 ABC transporter ATP-binding protein [Mucilaginibacter psychrotolerans]